MEITKEQILLKLGNNEKVLIPRQGIISLPIVNRIYKKMKANLKFKPIQTSASGLIIEGHHRYISSILSDFKIEEVSNYPEPAIVNDFE